jgi:hypothetical protein
LDPWRGKYWILGNVFLLKFNSIYINKMKIILRLKVYHFLFQNSFNIKMFNYTSHTKFFFFFFQFYEISVLAITIRRFIQVWLYVIEETIYIFGTWLYYNIMLEVMIWIWWFQSFFPIKIMMTLDHFSKEKTRLESNFAYTI